MNQEEAEQILADRHLTMKDHQTMNNKHSMLWHQKEGTRQEKATINLRTYLAKVRDTSEILFRVLKRYYIHLAKNIKMLRKKRTQGTEKSH